MRRMASAGKKPKSSASSREPHGRGRRHYVVCVSNDGYVASLDVRKVYLALGDRSASESGLLRVVDESGEAYLYPRGNFVDLAVTPSLARALAATV
jgi:hypothetical protein